MNLLQKFFQFIRKLIGPKVTKTQKTTTIKLNKTPSSNKISQRVSPPVQIKQVEHKQQTTITPFFEKPSDPVIQSHPTIITVDNDCISQLEPGIVIDANVLMAFETYVGKFGLPDITKYGPSIIKKLHKIHYYVPDIIEEEYRGKNLPRNRREIILNIHESDISFTGSRRNFKKDLSCCSPSESGHRYDVS